MSREKDVALATTSLDSDGEAKNKRQRTVVWLIDHQSKCREEAIFVNFLCASENVSCLSDLQCSLARVVLQFTCATRTSTGRPENEVVRHIK